MTGKPTSDHGETKGADFARVFGEARGHVPWTDYFSLASGYVSGVTDMPTYVSSISFDGVSKSVLDYVGEMRDASRVSDVEAAIDRLSGAPTGSDASKRLGPSMRRPV